MDRIEEILDLGGASGMGEDPGAGAVAGRAPRTTGKQTARNDTTSAGASWPQQD
jgi:hypothetical protein